LEAFRSQPPILVNYASVYLQIFAAQSLPIARTHG
jgi:hypothetical protein